MNSLSTMKSYGIISTNIEYVIFSGKTYIKLLKGKEAIKEMYIFMVNAVLADGLAPLNGSPCAYTVIIKSPDCILIYDWSLNGQPVLLKKLSQF